MMSRLLDVLAASQLGNDPAQFFLMHPESSSTVPFSKGWGHVGRIDDEGNVRSPPKLGGLGWEIHPIG